MLGKGLARAGLWIRRRKEETSWGGGGGEVLLGNAVVIGHLRRWK